MPEDCAAQERGSIIIGRRNLDSTQHNLPTRKLAALYPKCDPSKCGLARIYIQVRSNRWILVMAAVKFQIKDALGKTVLVATSATLRNHTSNSRVKRLPVVDNRTIT